MIKNYSTSYFYGFYSCRYLLVAVVELFVVSFFLTHPLFQGFGCGLIAFGAAFAGLEMTLRRVVDLGGIKQGVFDSLFWVSIKFGAPIGIIYFSVVRGFSVFWLFLGLFCGLVNVAGILLSEFQTKAKKS